MSIDIKESLPIRYEIKPIDLEKQRPTKIKDSFLELGSKHVEYVVIFRAEEPVNKEEPELGEWEEQITNLKVTAVKAFISGVERSHINKTGVWGVYIVVSGFGEDIKMFFKEEKEANNIYNILQRWLLK